MNKMFIRVHQGSSMFIADTERSKRTHGTLGNLRAIPRPAPCPYNPAPLMFRHVPNILTSLRLVLAGAFFVLLSFYQYEGRGDPFLLISAFIIYIAALVSDYLDGYLARKWNVASAFGRVVDPFADKILVLGSFIFFAGKNFIIPEVELIGHHGPHMVVKTITGVAPGMVVILLSRELLVTSLR